MKRLDLGHVLPECVAKAVVLNACSSGWVSEPDLVAALTFARQAIVDHSLLSLVCQGKVRLEVDQGECRFTAVDKLLDLGRAGAEAVGILNGSY